jgi:hypothetical protein
MLGLFTVVANGRVAKGIEIASLLFTLSYLLRPTVSLASKVKQTVVTNSNQAARKKAEKARPYHER